MHSKQCRRGDSSTQEAAIVYVRLVVMYVEHMSCIMQPHTVYHTLYHTQ